MSAPAPSPASSPPGPNARAWLSEQHYIPEEDREEGQISWTIQQWMAHYQARMAVKRTVAHSKKIREIKEAITKHDLATKFPELAETMKKLPAKCQK